MRLIKLKNKAASQNAASNLTEKQKEGVSNSTNQFAGGLFPIIHASIGATLLVDAAQGFFQLFQPNDIKFSTVCTI